MTNSNQNIHIVARGIIIDQGKILLCKTIGEEYVKHGFWTHLVGDFYYLPGGHIDYNESAIDALKRELIEEIGHEFKIGKFLTCIEAFINPEWQMCHEHEYSLLFEVECDKVRSNLPLTQIEPHMELIWMDLNKLENIDLRPSILKNIIKANFNNSFESEMRNDNV